MGKKLTVNLEILFRDSPMPVFHYEVKTFTTEGGLLRLLLSDRTSVWYPLCNVFRLKEMPENE